MKNFFLLLFLGISTAIIAQKNAYYQQFAKYKMEIDVDVKNYSYLGKQFLEYTNNSPETLKTVYFHLYWNAFKPGSMMDQRVSSLGKIGDSRLQKDGVSRLSTIPQAEQGLQNIKWIEQNGKKLAFEIQETIMKVDLADPLLPNSKTTFTMEWDSVIPMQIRRSGRNNKEGIEMTMTQWYPKIAEYDYEGWHTFDYVGREFHAPFADFEVNISIDPNYIIGAGGVLQNPNEVKGFEANATSKINKNGKTTWKWKAQNMLDFAWAADPDYIVESISVLDGPKVFFVYQKSEKTQFWEASKPLISRFFQIMNASYGRYEYPTYTFVQGGDGGMEYGMCTMILGEATTLKGLVGLMVHEGAHSWFQQMLATNESMSPWLDEGFTSYAESLVMNQLFQSDTPKPNPFVDTINGYIKFHKSGRETPAIWLADDHDDGNAYSIASYYKGEAFLVQLGYIVGEKTLQSIMKEFVSEWKMKHPNARDFMHIAQKNSSMDLKWFYHYWINTTKFIDYAIKNVEYTKENTVVTLENKGQIPMPIDFSVLTKDNKVITYQIPLNMTRVWKKYDVYGNFITQSYWPWTQKEYQLTIPFLKEQLQAIGIDFSQRLADINPEDNFKEIQ